MDSTCTSPNSQGMSWLSPPLSVQPRATRKGSSRGYSGWD